MDRLRPAGARGVDDRLNIKVAFRGRGGTDPDRLVRLRDMERTRVGIAEHRDRADAHAL
jgi:hypothetical protein